MCYQAQYGTYSILQNEALEVFQRIYFVNAQGQRFFPPTVKNFIQDIWRICKSLGFKFLCPRHLTQDHLRLFSSMVRSHGIRNVSPFKALIVNNCISVNSPKTNCEADNYDCTITSMGHFLARARNYPQQEGTSFDGFMENMYFQRQVSHVIEKQHA